MRLLGKLEGWMGRHGRFWGMEVGEVEEGGCNLLSGVGIDVRCFIGLGGRGNEKLERRMYINYRYGIVPR